MESLRINIRNPKAKKLLEDLAALDLIEIKPKEDYKAEFFKLINELRAKNTNITLEDIDHEVEEFRKGKKN